jgi:type I restriction enzyme M protein
MKYVFDHSLKSSVGEEKKKYVKNNLFGIEINSMIARMAKMRMILEGDGYSNIVTSDSLANWDDVNHDISKTNGQLRDYQYYFDVVMTNPPFGTQGKISNETLLQEYKLGSKQQDQEGKKNKTSGQVPDILFIERSLNFLKEGGKLAIVLPNGDLENSSLDYVREFIKDKTDILAVIKLPTDTFIPFGTGVKTSILFLQKKGGNIKTVDKVFFGLIEKIGYEGNKNGTIVYKKDSNGNKIKDSHGNNIIDEDLTDLINAYKQFLTGTFKDTDNFFAIDRKEIKTRFDLEYYKPSSRDMEKKLNKNNAVRLGELVEIRKNKSIKLKQPELTVKYIELADINTDYFEISNFTSSKVHDLPSRASYEIEEGDILTAVAGNAIGTNKHMSALVPKILSGSICTNGFRILKAKKIDPYYLLYYLKTPYFLEQVYKYRTGAAIPSISDTDLANILVFRPSLKKEKEIAKLMSESIKLREEAKRILNTIALEL